MCVEEREKNLLVCSNMGQKTGNYRFFLSFLREIGLVYTTEVNTKNNMSYIYSSYSEVTQM